MENRSDTEKISEFMRWLDSWQFLIYNKDKAYPNMAVEMHNGIMQTKDSSAWHI